MNLKSTKRYKWRWYALVLQCCFVLGYYFSLDNPAELQASIVSKFAVSETKYSLLYSLYAAPNMVLPLVCGYFLDKIGTYNGLVLCGLFVASGQSIVTYGAYVSSFNVILAGRVVFALGAETLWVV